LRTTDYIGEEIIAKTASWLSVIRGSVAQRPHLVLNPPRAALLVIDMQRYFAHQSGRCFLGASKAAVLRIKLLLDTWRQRGGLTIFTRHSHTGLNDLGMLGRFFSDYIKEGDKSAEIIEALSPEPHEIVIRKNTYDAFLNTPLESLLHDHGIEQVVICGVLTHMCVETTARSAFCRGFEVYIPADGTASSREDLHVNSLLAAADSFAIVTSVDEVILACQK
jgi:nicotinamidase-related amidase